MHKGYSGLQIGLHWVVALLVVINLVISQAMARSYDAVQDGVVGGTTLAAIVHITVGLTILVLIVARLSVKLARRVEHAHEPSQVLTVVGLTNHWLMYGTLLALPILGFMAWFANQRWAASLHGTFAVVLLALAGLHIAAALWHQFGLKNNLIRRMVKPDSQADPSPRRP